MKKFKSFYMVAAMLVAAVAFGFSSCSSDDDDDGESNISKSDLIGTWKRVYLHSIITKDNDVEYKRESENSSKTYQLKLDADGTYSQAFYYDGNWRWDWYGGENHKWTYKKGKITLTYDEKNKKYTTVWNIITLTSSELTLEKTEKGNSEEDKNYVYFMHEEYKKISD